MAPSKKRRSRKKVVLRDTETPFPFMSLPPELRLMIYDVLIREQTDIGKKWDVPADLVVLSEDHTSLSSSVKSLLKVKDIRAELLSRLIRRYQFEWAGSGNFETNRRWLSFRRCVLPFINNFTVSVLDPDKPFERHTKLFCNILNWMRWRSQRSHLYPWQLKSLTVQEASRRRAHPTDPYWMIAFWMNMYLDPTEHEVCRFLRGAPMVPGLDSLKIVLQHEPHSEGAKAFLARCAVCGVEGKVGLWDGDRRRVVNWRHLEQGRLVWTAA